MSGTSHPPGECRARELDNATRRQSTDCIPIDTTGVLIVTGDRQWKEQSLKLFSVGDGRDLSTRMGGYGQAHGFGECKEGKLSLGRMAGAFDQECDVINEREGGATAAKDQKCDYRVKA